MNSFTSKPRTEYLTSSLEHPSLKYKNKIVNYIVYFIQSSIFSISNRVLVLEDGEIVEFDTPSKLMINKESKFFKMADNAGLTQNYKGNTA